MSTYSASHLSSGRGRLVNVISNYQRFVAKTLWIMTLIAWLMSFAFASSHNTWGLALVVGGALTAINTFLAFKAPQ
ncbi:hypothetical protein HDN1F_35970 [gamma proteobacterium HdN1]|nr:hypothetical protein HDN1F_35970 [gamma proteobacterium HdN1]